VTLIQQVPSAAMPPYQCAVFPTLGANHPKGYFDTGNEIPDLGPNSVRRYYVSVEGVEQLATRLGWAPPADHSALAAKVTAQEIEIDRLNDELREADKALEAVDTLARRGFQPRAAA
jgi:hypothetical protein